MLHYYGKGFSVLLADVCFRSVCRRCHISAGALLISTMSTAHLAVCLLTQSVREGIVPETWHTGRQSNLCFIIIYWKPTLLIHCTTITYKMPYSLKWQMKNTRTFPLQLLICVPIKSESDSWFNQNAQNNYQIGSSSFIDGHKGETKLQFHHTSDFWESYFTCYHIHFRQTAHKFVNFLKSMKAFLSNKHLST